MIIGSNFVELIGKIEYPSLKTFDEGCIFKANLAIPTQENSDQHQYIKITAWSNIALLLNDLPKGSFIKLHGHIEEKVYDGRCKHCAGFDKKYYTEVIVDNFIIIKE